MKILLLTLFALSLNAFAVRISDTVIKTVVLDTKDSFKTEAEALEEAFRLEDLVKDKKSSEYRALKKNCIKFVQVVEPTVVRLHHEEDKIRGKVFIKIRCER